MNLVGVDSLVPRAARHAEIWFGFFFIQIKFHFKEADAATQWLTALQRLQCNQNLECGYRMCSRQHSPHVQATTVTECAGNNITYRISFYIQTQVSLHLAAFFFPYTQATNQRGPPPAKKGPAAFNSTST
jgi:hypothetical protein